MQSRIKKTIEFKKRRLMLKKNRSRKSTTKSRKEGVSYTSGMSFEDVSNLIEMNNTDTTVEDVSDCQVVIFDLETSGLKKCDVILQIAATTPSSDFNVYVLPSESVDISSTSVTGLHMINGCLYLHEKAVEAVPEKEALQLFLNYLRQFGTVILLAHNGFRFDFPRILKLIMKCQMLLDFIGIVKGFSDSLLIIKEKLPQRVKDKKRFSVEALVTDFLVDVNSQSLHNAVEDVRILGELLRKLEISNTIIIAKSKDMGFILKKQNDQITESLNKASLQEYQNFITRGMMTKMAKARINKNILKKVFETSGEDGLRFLMSENIGGRPRVTNNKKVLQKICQIFTQNN